MKHPIITSLGLAVLASISLVTPSMASLVTITGAGSGNLAGSGFVNFPFVWEINFSTENPYTDWGLSSPIYSVASSQITFGTDVPITVSTAIGDLGAARGMWFNYSGPDTSLAPMDDIPGGNLMTLHVADTWDGVTDFHSSNIDFGMANQPISTSNGGLSFDSISLSSVDISGMSAIPEVTSSFTMLGLISSGLLLRRRSKALR